MTPEAYPAILIAEEVGRILDENRVSEAERLNRVVTYLKNKMHVDVSTLYRRGRVSGDLYIEASDGLEVKHLGQVALRKNEGLTGIVVRTRRPLPVRDGPSHPNFRYVPGTGEELFHSYLGVPILESGRVIGALVVQTRAPRDFDREEIALLANVARQISEMTYRVYDRLEKEGKTKSKRKRNTESRMQIIRGRSLAPGAFASKPVVLDRTLDLKTVVTPQSKGEAAELEAIRAANRKVRQDLRDQAQAISGDGQQILLAHKVLLEDEQLAEDVMSRIREGKSASEAVRCAAMDWISKIEKIPDPAFAGRATDFRDIANRLMHALGIKDIQPVLGDEKIVAVARTILPGELLEHGPKRLGALVMTDQGVHSHTAIIARSFDIPAVQVETKNLEDIIRAENVLVDGTEGLVALNPSTEQIADFVKRSNKLISVPEGGPTDLTQQISTKDDVQLKIGMNAGLLVEFDNIDHQGPDNVGLFRSEITFMNTPTLPNLRAQIAMYRKVMKAAKGRKVVFRTFDFGGDKIPHGLQLAPEDNPMMGFRSTRYTLRHPEILRTQIKALLTVSAEAPMSILIPMISTSEELNLVLDEINKIKNEMDRTGVAFNRGVEIGIMLEVPSVMFQIDELSRASDFFCVGSNDLMQYLMAADRSNSHVGHLYQWHHPAILMALDYLLRQCNKSGRSVTLCGEMASHPWAAMLLVGMGYHQLSLDAHAIPLVKWVLQQCSYKELRTLTQSVTRASSSTEVIELLYAALDGIGKETPTLLRPLTDSLDRLRERALW